MTGIGRPDSMTRTVAGQRWRTISITELPIIPGMSWSLTRMSTRRPSKRSRAVAASATNSMVHSFLYLLKARRRPSRNSWSSSRKMMVGFIVAVPVM